ncbi:NUDIX hydrolase [Ornithinibacillus sp. BX22]|uniref:NUDIX hydrolase n=1 Tax=Ornithinibacillus hominis TaxID=2763055 RepID=A0A923L562_9BACI|nr:NUDIX hydrolase [Ornithinibacillus hominis]MBC5636672.1 NUDIX hydrolase [Ornithinibacillus hominis]
MEEWRGSAAICINNNREVLMVRAKGSSQWAVPSGGIEEGETPEHCCIREVKEETGYTVTIKEEIYVKKVVKQGISVTTHYFVVDRISNSSGINDPDQLIEEMAWFSLEGLAGIEHAYPEDEKLIEKCLKSQMID